MEKKTNHRVEKIIGHTVDSEGRLSEEKKILVIEGSHIKKIDDTRGMSREEIDAVAREPNTLVLDGSCAVYPGFLDLHTHITYNMIPWWESGKVWNNRFQWRGYAKYNEELYDFHQNIVNSYVEERTEVSDEDCLMQLQVLAEIQAIAGGTTVIQESEEHGGDSSDPDRLVSNDHYLLKSTGNPPSLGMDEDRQIYNVIQFFLPDREVESGDNSPDTADWKPVGQDAFQTFRESLRDNSHSNTLVHLAEGVYGWLGERGKDSYSRSEFEAFKKSLQAEGDDYILRKRSEGKGEEELREEFRKIVWNKNISLIHCCGIEPTGENIAFLKEFGINILWAPVSNTILYGDTLDVLKFLEKGVNVALGSDWSPSGGKHIWDEAKFAYFLFTRICGKDREESMRMIYQMITVRAARCLNRGNSRMGRIGEGQFADLVLLRDPKVPRGGKIDPLEFLFHNDDEHVYGVIINGKLLYGDEMAYVDLVSSFTYSLAPRSTNRRTTKYVHLDNEKVDFNVQEALDELEVFFDRYNTVQGREMCKLQSFEDDFYQRKMAELRKDLLSSR
ncbi:MAG: amidohydrolase family protein [Spirochaetales bacterium]|nr:amidohydrolase family protein [Spirochaetales bacterium]